MRLMSLQSNSPNALIVLLSGWVIEKTCPFCKGRVKCPKSQLINIRWDLNQLLMSKPLFNAFAMVLGSCSVIPRDEFPSVDTMDFPLQLLLQRSSDLTEY